MLPPFFFLFFFLSLSPSSSPPNHSPEFEFPPSMSLNSLATSLALAHEPLAARRPCTKAPTRAACGAKAFPPGLAVSLCPA